ncbi:MAG: protein kinase [Verrucomicrobiota bacterium]
MPDEETPEPPPTGPGPGASNPGASFVPPTIEELQAALPQYQVLEMIGMGGMGAVFKAKQINLDRLVAIKVLPSNLDLFGQTQAPGGEAASGSSVTLVAERFQREAQAMAKLHHPRIIAVHDFGKTDDYLYIVMEFVEGTDLSDLIAKNALTHDQTLAIITQTCDALQYAHEQGIVHRDIKPANIMLDVHGQVKIADFGLAKLTGADHAQLTQLTMTNMAMGTPDYVAPEALELGVEVDHRADVYSLGVMLYQMLTGSIPRGLFQPPSQKKPDLDPRLDTVVANAMQSERDARYQSVTELWTDVDEIRTTPNTQVAQQRALQTGRVAIKPGQDALTRQVEVPATTHTKTAASSKKTLLWTLSTATVLIAAAVLAFLFFNPTDEDSSPPDSAQTPSLERSGPGPAGKRPPHLKQKSGGGGGSGPPPHLARRANRQDIAPNNPPPGSDSPPASVPSTSKEIDLLANLDLESDTRRGTWTLENGALTGRTLNTQPGNRTWMRLPGQLPDHYTFRATLHPVVANESTNFLLPVADRHIELVLGGKRNHHEKGPMSGLSTIADLSTPDNETAVFNHSLEADKTHQLEARVAAEDGEATIEVDLDGERLIRWSGPVDQLAANVEQWKGNLSPRRLYLGTYATAVTEFSNLTLNPGTAASTPALTSPPKSPAPSGDTIELLPLIDLDRDTVLGTWSLTEAGALLHRIKDSYARLDFPIDLTGPYRLTLTYTASLPGRQVGVGLRTGDTSTTLRIDGALDAHASGIALIDGLSPDGTNANPTFTDSFKHDPAAEHTLVLTVRPDDENVSIQATIDGQSLVDWEGAQSRLRLPPFYEPNQPVAGIALTAARTSVTFLEATLESLDGSPLSISLPSSSPSTPPTEAAKPSEIPPNAPPGSDPEAAKAIAALYQKYEDGYNTTILAEHHEAVTDLNTKYLAALERDKSKATQAGDLETTLAFQTEIDALENADTDFPTSLPALPPETPQTLSDRRHTWNQSIGQLVTTLETEAAKLIAPLDNELAALESQYTREDNLALALEIRTARETLKSNGLPFLTPAPAQAQSNQSPPSESPSPTPSTNQPAIPDDAVEFNGHFYKFFPEEVAWTEANARCNDLGGHLAMIETEEENEFLAELIIAIERSAQSQDRLAWIGLAQVPAARGEPNVWTWVSGQPLDGFSNWIEPDKANRDHLSSSATLARRGHWRSQPRSNLRAYLCEWSSDPTSE